MSTVIRHDPLTPHPLDACMDRAIQLAECGRWKACPNPTVGAVLVRDGQIVAEGFHTACGSPHAEIECLRAARKNGIQPADCTLVVTLEPCNHYGKTPPCAKAVLEAGIRSVVVGVRDPNPAAAGGLEFLAEHGVRVEYGVREQSCRDLIADFLIRQKSDRPYILLKLASTLDGRIATRTGHSRWISNEASRRQVQYLRAGVGLCGGAVLIGASTFRADNPRLTVRQPIPALYGTNAPRQPLACVLTSRLPEATADYALLQQRPRETLFATTYTAASSPRAAALRALGIRVWGLPAAAPDGPLQLLPLFVRLRKELDCPYVLCEGGGTLALSLLTAGLVDEFLLHLSPRILGDDKARPLFSGRCLHTMDEALNMCITHTAMCQDDLHITLRPR